MTHPHAYSTSHEMQTIRRRWAREAAWGWCKLIAGVGFLCLVLVGLTIPH